MKSGLIVSKFLLVLTIIASTSCFAQSENRTRIVATWDLSKFEILKTVEDSLSIRDRLKDVSLTFQNDTLVITKRKARESDQFIKSGPYRLSDDGTKMFLNDEPAEILTLSSHQLLLKVRDDYIMHLIKRRTSK